MDTISLKEHIYKENKIEYILESIGCGNIKYHQNKEFYSCSNYNGDNPGAVNVKNNSYLGVTNWTRPNEFSDSSDIFDLIQYNRRCSFIDAVKYLHDILGIPYTKYKKPEQKKHDPLDVFKRIKNFSRRVDVSDIQYLPENYMDEFIPLPHIDWFRDGIMPWTAKKFGLAYSYKRKRVVIPHRYWISGGLMGVNMRTTVENYDALGIKKYYLTEGYNKSINLYGLYENYESIQKAGYVVVFESEKSVLKRDSLNDSTGVAISGKILSDEQVRILIGLNVEIVIALDKDVCIEEVRAICEKFRHIRRVSYMYDAYDLIGKKDSPADASNKIFNFLFKYRIEFDENEHKKYLDSLKK